MVIKIQSADEFRRLLTALVDELVTANIHFKLYRDLEKAASEYANEFNSANTFFHLTFRAHIETAMNRLCKTYDQEAKSLNLVNLIDTISANLHLFEEVGFRDRLKGNPFVDSLAATSRVPRRADLEADRRYVVAAENPRVKALMKFRGNYVAHRSPAHALDPTLLGNMPYSDIHALLDDGIKMANRYSSLFAAFTHLPTIMGDDDYLIVLEALRVRREQRLAERRAELEKCGPDVIDIDNE